MLAKFVDSADVGIKATYDWEWAAADTCYQRALALEPGNALVVRSAAGLAATLGRLDEALVLHRRAVELDPLSAAAWMNLGTYAYYAGRHDEAMAAFRKSPELNAFGHRAFLTKMRLPL